jgi:hypothetical protein
MSKLKKLYKGSKPSKIIKVFEAGEVWDADIYVRPYPRNKIKHWFKELEDQESNAGSQAVSRIFELMASFSAMCICDESGQFIADDSPDAVEFLLSIDDDSILIDLYRESSKASGLMVVAEGLLELFDIDSATVKAAGTKENGKKRSKRK